MPKSIAPPNIWNGRKKNSVSRSSNRGETTTLIRFISTNPAGTIGRSSRTSMLLKWAWERQQIRTGPNRFRQKSFRARLRSPSSYPRHSGKRGSRSLRALYSEVLGLEVVKLPYTKLISHLRLIAGLGESKISKRSKPTAKSLPFSSATSTATGGRLRAQEHS